MREEDNVLLDSFGGVAAVIIRHNIKAHLGIWMSVAEDRLAYTAFDSFGVAAALHYLGEGDKQTT